MERVTVHVLGRFAVDVDGRPLPDDAFAQRRAADLVKVLALAPAHRLSRDRVVEMLWPRLPADAGTANLHKAAHYARRALGARDAIVLRQGSVELAPSARVETDAERFERDAEAPYGGELLPDDRYEDWAVGPRERLRDLRIQRLGAAGRWADVVAEDPADEQAHRELMRADLAAGDRLAAARRFRLLRDELGRLGLRPSGETLELERRLAEGPPVRAARAPGAPVVGRDAELAHVVHALRGATEGDGAALVVCADAGMGKTRYVETALGGAERRGWHTLRGRARAGSGGVPYQPVIEALDPLIVERPDLLARLAPGSRTALAALSPAAGEEAGGSLGRHRVLTAVGHLLREAALERGALLALEDLHAADQATLELVEYLGGTARREPLVLVLTTRPAGAGEPVMRLRGALREQRAVTDVFLGPLSEKALEAIAARAAEGELAPDAVAAVARAAAGNPLYAQELARAVDEEGRVRVPDHLHELLDARLAALPDAVQATLPALAVVQDGFAAAELVAVGGLTAEEAGERLAQAAAGDLLVQEAGGWRFAHPLLREAARRRTPAPDLARAHAEAARHLAAGGAAPERVAHHLLHAGRPGEAVPYLASAARHAAEVGAYADGRRWIEQALAHASAAERPALFAVLGDLRFATGDRAALGAYAAAVKHAQDGELPGLKVRQAMAAIALGDLETAERALAGLPAGTGAQRARATLALAMLAWYRGDIDGAARSADEAAALAEAAGIDLEQLADVRAMVAHASGSWETHTQLEVSEVWHLPQLAGRVFDAYLCVTEYVLHAGDPYARLIRFAEDLGRQAREAGARRGEAFSATVLGEAHLLAGDAEVARQHLAQGAGLSREVGAVGGEALARARLGEALDALGDRAGARAHLEEALELSHASKLAHHLLFLVHAPLLRVQDDVGAALALVDASEFLLREAHACKFCPISYALAAASVCAGAGDPDRAEAFLAQAEGSARLWPPGVWTPAVCEARGDILQARGDPREAAVAWRRALEGYAAAGQRLNEGRVAASIARLEPAAAGGPAAG